MAAILSKLDSLPTFVPRAVIEAVVVRCPLYLWSVPAGFPSPAEEYIERKLDLNEYLVRNPVATFFFRVEGRSMEGAGILDGDVVSADRSIDPRHGHIVIAAVDNKFTVKTLYMRGTVIELHAENPDFKPIKFSDGQELRIAGVVTGCIKKFPV
jgi:DNA polymerase V